MKSVEEIENFLGLPGRTIGKAQKIRLRGEREQVAQGFVAKDLDFNSFLTDEEALSLECETAEEMGFEIAHFEAWPELIRVYTPTAGFRQLPESIPMGVYEQSAVEAFFVDFKTYRAPLAIVDGRGEGICLQYEEGVLEISQILDLRDVPGSGSVLESDLEAWVEVTKDEWLIGEVRRLCSYNTDLSHWIAMGIYLRLEEIQEREERAARVRQILSGELPEKNERVRAWVLDLPISSIQRLRRLALEEVEALREELLELEEKFMTGEEIAASQIGRICRRRDELTGAGRLFSYVKDHDPWNSYLSDFDEIGERLIKDLCLLALDVGDDEYLRRASFVRANDWWTYLVWNDSKESEY